MIIGASGYVGRHLCKILSKKYTVFGTFFRHSLYLNGESVFLDIRDKTSVFELLRQIRPQLIYHLAYDLKDLEGSIVRGTDNLLQAKRRAEIDVLRTGGIVVRPSLVYGFNPPDSRTATLLQGLETDVFEYLYFIEKNPSGDTVRQRRNQATKPFDGYIPRQNAVSNQTEEYRRSVRWVIK